MVATEIADYTVMICGKETYLFDEENGKWFVEGKSRVAT